MIWPLLGAVGMGLLLRATANAPLWTFVFAVAWVGGLLVGREGRGSSGLERTSHGPLLGLNDDGVLGDVRSVGLPPFLWPLPAHLHQPTPL
jgi:hypothetical protein